MLKYYIISHLGPFGRTTRPNFFHIFVLFSLVLFDKNDIESEKDGRASGNPIFEYNSVSGSFI